MRRKRKKTLSQQVYTALTKDIALGRFLPGERLTTEHVATMLEVSHTPVREAFTRMAQEGLVDLRPHYGATVKKISDELAKEFIEIRALLEPRVTRRLARCGVNGKLIKQLRTACDDFENSTTFVDMSRADFEFHDLILNAPGSGLAAELIRGHNILISAFFYYRGKITLDSVQKDKSRSANDHYLIVDAIEAGNGEEAYLLMQKHIGLWDDYIAETEEDKQIGKRKIQPIEQKSVKRIAQEVEVNK